ncbi:hypothetical protein B0H11DRAFT_2286963 [Mycena galericulata]|nr:hypothetical protein B0H11DRAFT_2286963 [Mycena galericulata]
MSATPSSTSPLSACRRFVRVRLSATSVLAPPFPFFHSFRISHTSRSNLPFLLLLFVSHPPLSLACHRLSAAHCLSSPSRSIFPPSSFRHSILASSPVVRPLLKFSILPLCPRPTPPYPLFSVEPIVLHSTETNAARARASRGTADGNTPPNVLELAGHNTLGGCGGLSSHRTPTLRAEAPSTSARGSPVDARVDVQDCTGARLVIGAMIVKRGGNFYDIGLQGPGRRAPRLHLSFLACQPLTTFLILFNLPSQLHLPSVLLSTTLPSRDSFLGVSLDLSLFFVIFYYVGSRTRILYANDHVASDVMRRRRGGNREWPDGNVEGNDGQEVDGFSRGYLRSAHIPSSSSSAKRRAHQPPARPSTTDPNPHRRSRVFHVNAELLWFRPSPVFHACLSHRTARTRGAGDAYPVQDDKQGLVKGFGVPVTIRSSCAEMRRLTAATFSGAEHTQN